MQVVAGVGSCALAGCWLGDVVGASILWDGLVIYIGYYHGLCIYDQPYAQKGDYLIAWGGVGAQLLLALPLVTLAILMEGYEVPAIYVLTNYLGYLSILVACLNLLPLRGLDGAKAWRLIPLYLAERRHHRQAAREAQKLPGRIK